MTALARHLAAVAVALVVAGCAEPRGVWHVMGASWDPQPIAAAAELVTGDHKGWIRRGGIVMVQPTLDGLCWAGPGFKASGCALPGTIYILRRGAELEQATTAHELCHLGLVTGGGYSGPVVEASEPQADACALVVMKELLR